MKKQLSLLMLLVALVLPGASMAQSHNVVVGNWSSTSSSAFGGFHNTQACSWTQTLYLQSEMQGAGWIRAIILDNRSTAPNVLDSAKIYLGTTTMTTHPTAAVSTWVPMNDLTLVWSRNNYTIPGVRGILVIELDQPFYYDGTNTLALVISKAAATNSSSTMFGYVSTTNSFKYTAGTTESYCSFPTVAGTNSSYKENVIFVVTNAQTDNYCLPIEGVKPLVPNSNTAVGLSWNGVAGASYEVGCIGYNDSRTGMSTFTTSDTSYIFNGLVPDSLYCLYVRKQCSNGVYSEWDSVLVRTLCLPKSARCFFRSTGCRKRAQ